MGREFICAPSKLKFCLLMKRAVLVPNHDVRNPIAFIEQKLRRLYTRRQIEQDIGRI
jgi:hypothetical protein